MTVSKDYLQKMDAYWRAANYLSAAQLYLLDNPLLREPLRKEHIKKRLSDTGEPCPDKTLSMCI